MKTDNKILVLLVLVLCSWGTALAWHEYRPMIVEGRRWDCINYLYFIKGDTIIDGLRYKKVYQQRHLSDQDKNMLDAAQYKCAVREEDRKVYVVNESSDGKPYLLYIFSLGAFQKSDTIYGAPVSELAIDAFDSFNCDINGIERRFSNVGVMTFTAMSSQLEGIGYIFDSTGPFSIPGLDVESPLSTCSDGDKILFDISRNFNPVPIVDGEINGDGTVDVGDVNAVISMVLRRPMRPGWDDVAADMDQNATLDAGDANALISIILGK